MKFLTRHLVIGVVLGRDQEHVIHKGEMPVILYCWQGSGHRAKTFSLS